MAGTRATPPGGSENPVSELTHKEAAEYIASMLEGLRSVAKGAEMPFLAYLIDIALEEAKIQKGREAAG